MDINDLRSLFTALGFIVFIALMTWTWRTARKPDHDAASMLPFEGDAAPSIEDRS